MSLPPLVSSTRRADSILQRIGTARRLRRGRHRAAPRPVRSRTGLVAGVLTVTAGLGVLGVGTATVAFTDPAPSVAVVAAVSVSELERTFLAELAEAGVLLDGPDATAAVEIAREHVAHGHLVGMRERIREDVRAALPWLTEEQVETAKVAVEHHFLAVLGRPQ